MAKQKTIDDLNKMYNDSVSADKDLWAEQRSNVLLIAGNHYSGKGAKNWERLRDARNVPSEQKIRLTKNHIQKITKSYLNNIVSTSPGVQITPRNEKEIQDQKCAQLNSSVWLYAKDELRLDLKVINWAKDYVDIGECAVKIYWNPNAGEFKGYEQAVDPMGMPVVDESGQPEGDKSKPQFKGKLEIEQILPSNLLRDAQATSMDESPWVGVRKMVPYEDMEALVGDNSDLKKLIEPSKKDEYMVFDSNSSEYAAAKGQVLVVEYYFRPCATYPMGYFYITTKSGVLFEGELPYGIFPIEYVGFDGMQTSPRHRSIIKQLRPYQLEINRTASKIAEHQVTSDDKILIQSGTKISSGGVLPGVRAIQYSGQAPTILEGRSGAQYVDYMNSQISEMYNVANVAEDAEPANTSAADPYGMLFRSVKDQKKFVIYGEKFEQFLKAVCLTYLKLAKQYFTDDMLIPMIGKSEYVNISEFRSADEVHTQIKVVPMSDDVNSMFGKWMAINHTIQYVGQQLGKEDIGRLLRNVPYGNFEESFSDLTMNYDLATNYILALERGEWAEPSPADDKLYMVKRLEKRMRESDFRMLHPQIQQMFAQAKDMYNQMEVDEKLALQRAQQGFIPTGGPLIKTDLQIQLPNSTGGMKTTRAAFPVEALSWLQKQLEVQGSSLGGMMELPQAAATEIANKFNGQSAGFNEVDPNSGRTQTTINEQANAQQGVPRGNGQPSQFPR